MSIMTLWGDMYVFMKNIITVISKHIFDIEHPHDALCVLGVLEPPQRVVVFGGGFPASSYTCACTHMHTVM